MRRTLLRAAVASTVLVALFPAATPALPAADGGGGGDASVAANAAMLAPKPVKAGSVVTASVRTTSGGAPVRPSGVRCTGTIGSARVRGVPRTTRGTASCTYRTPVAAQGKTLRGTIALTVRDKRFVRRFATRLS